MLEGSLHVRVGKEVVEAHAGSAVFVPRATPHTYGHAPVRYLRFLRGFPTLSFSHERYFVEPSVTGKAMNSGTS